MLIKSEKNGKTSARRRRGWLRGTLAIAVAFSLLTPLELPLLGGEAAPAAAAQDPSNAWPAGEAGDSFADWAPTVFIGQRSYPTKLFRVEQSVDVNAVNQTTGTGKFELIGGQANTYNALSYRLADDYLYAMRINGAQKQIVRIGKGGHTEHVARATELPLLNNAGGWNAGTFGQGADADHMYIRAATELRSHLYRLDMSGLPPADQIDTSTDLPVLDMVLSQEIQNTADLVYKDGHIWTFDQTRKGRIGNVYRVELEDSDNDGIYQVDQFEIDYGYRNLVFGAQWSYGNGNVGLSDNNSGKIFQYEIKDANTSTPEFIPIFAEPLRGGKSTLNDGTAKVSPGVDLNIVKQAPATVIAGSSFEFTLTVTNPTENWSSGFVVADTVPAGFESVEVLTSGCNALPLTTTGETEVKCVGGMLAPGASVEIKIRATFAANETKCLPNTATVLGNEADPGPSDNTSTATVCPGDPGLKIEKTATFVTGDPDSPQVGDTITYRVDVTNIGDSNYPVDTPAVVTDDLSAVLDDADFDDTTLKFVGTPVGTLTYDAPRVTWSGPLTQSATVSFTMDVTLTRGGDGEVRNVAFEGAGDTPLCNPPVDEIVEGVVVRWIDEPTGVPCFSTEHQMPRLTITKAASMATLPATRGNIKYTVTVKNEGPGDWASTDPAMTDDLTDILPVAPLDTTAPLTSDVGAAVLVGQQIEWIGALDSGDEATITFEVTYDPALDVSATPGVETPGVLTNIACVPLDDTLPGADNCATVTLKSLRTDQWKGVSASSDPIGTGTVLTYTLHFANNGTLPFDVYAVDHLDDVLDDATFTSGPDVVTAPEPLIHDDLSAIYSAAEQHIIITGTLEEDESATVTYTVTVKPEADRLNDGNNRAVNFLIDGPPTVEPPEECVPAEERPNCTVTQLPGSIIWQKTDEYETPLAGSEWSLTPVDSEGQSTGPATLVTDCIEVDAADCAGPDIDPTAGGFRVVGLTYGLYELTETAAPPGYLLDAMPIAQVDLATAVVDLGIFLNFQQWVPDIPLTGGLGTYIFTIAGFLALAAMVSLILWRSRRKHT